MKYLKSILLMTLLLVSITVKAGPVDQLTSVGTYCFELYGTTRITSLLLTVYSNGTNNYFPVYGVHTLLAPTPVYGNAIIDERNQATVSITTSSTSIYLAVYTLFLDLDKNLSGIYRRISYVQLKTVQAGGYGYDLGFDSGSVVMKDSCEQ
jgi:hypothetical protein